MRNQSFYPPSSEDMPAPLKFPRRTSSLRNKRPLPHIVTMIEPEYNRQLFTLHECADDASRSYHKRSFSMGSSRTPTSPGLVESPYSDVSPTLRMFSTSYVMTKPQGNSTSYFDSCVRKTRQVVHPSQQKPQGKVQNWLSKLPNRRESPFEEKRRDDEVCQISKPRQPCPVADASTSTEVEKQFLDLEEDDESETSDSEDTGDLDGYHEALFRFSAISDLDLGPGMTPDKKRANPWLDGHVQECIKRHVPDAICHEKFTDIPEDADTVYQLLNGWELNHHFAVLNRSKHGLLNAYPNSDALARKDHMASVVDYWITKRPESVLKGHSPATVKLSLDYSEYVEDALAAADDLTLLYSLEDNEAKDSSERDWWILKPAMIDCGHGIRIFSTIDELAGNLELAADISEEDEESEDDAETPDTKFESDDSAEGFKPSLSAPGLDSLDALITATGKLSIQGSNKIQDLVIDEHERIPSALLREFVAQQYIVNIPPIDGRKWHVRAYVLSVGRLKVHVFNEMLALLALDDYEPPWKNPTLKSSLTNTALQDEEEFTSKESMRDFWKIDDDLLPGDWKKSIFDQACQISGELLRAAAHTMADKFTPLDKCFELFAIDFLTDSKGTAWLLEVNETPAFYEQGYAGELAQRLMESLICVTLEHMGMADMEIIGYSRFTEQYLPGTIHSPAEDPVLDFLGPFPNPLDRILLRCDVQSLFNLRQVNLQLRGIIARSLAYGDITKALPLYQAILGTQHAQRVLVIDFWVLITTMRCNVCEESAMLISIPEWLRLCHTCVETGERNDSGLDHRLGVSRFVRLNTLAEWLASGRAIPTQSWVKDYGVGLKG
ncbi:tubulin-tyrosine ligase [Fusarium tjaetaba]|uniref:Tubulin-tyrosine ligase n=1 Tax=Fusarium tjaetaba TaxID=1567544 RepID=A0A8H5W3H6_9HYPO|nr:tubulin-tyrosine ligase [Fusarium tjaetaba]KAF5643504.1 tubulin-tyrosine ligase [Fusarium tjaetaba]